MNKSVVAVAAVFFLVFGISLSFGQNVSSEARRHFDLGMAANAKVDFETALKEFRQAAILAPDWPDAFYNLGLVEEWKRLYADAFYSLQRYLSLAPNASDSEEVKIRIKELYDEARSSIIGFSPDVNAKLITAFLYNNTEEAELLIAKGADVNAKDERGWTLLHNAVGYKKKEMLISLIAKGADVNATTNDNLTPLGLAQDDDEIAPLLIAKGAIKKIPSLPLFFIMAASSGTSGMELLIDRGMDVNAKDEDGLTPLHHAASHGRKEMVELLIAKGADINAKDNKGQTPLQMAVDSKHKEIEELLRKHGAK